MRLAAQPDSGWASSLAEGLTKPLSGMGDVRPIAHTSTMREAAYFVAETEKTEARDHHWRRVVIEFPMTDGKSMWVSSTHIVSLITRKNFASDDLTTVKLSDGTEWHAAEPARDLGRRVIDATGMHMGASPNDAALGPSSAKG